MAAKVDPVELIERLVKSVPEDQEVFLSLSLDSGGVRHVLKSLMNYDRNGDLLDQLTNHLEKKCEKRGQLGTYVVVRGKKGKAATYGSPSGTLVHLALADTPAAAPAAERKENPVTPAIDPMETLEAEIKKAERIRDALERKCLSCSKPESKCVCPCEGGCGALPHQTCKCCEDCQVTPCTCEPAEDGEQPDGASILAAGARYIGTEKGEKVLTRVLNGLGDLLEKGGDRLLFGQQPRPAAAKAAAAATQAAAPVVSGPPKASAGPSLRIMKMGEQ